MPRTVPSLTAILMTDDMGKVVFVDSHFLTIMGYEEAGMVIGEPLNHALGNASCAINQLVDELQEAGHIFDRPITLENMAGQAIQVRFAGHATYDHRGLFIGADLSLETVMDESQAIPAKIHTGKIDVHLLETYFTLHLQSVADYMIMIGGKSVRSAVETLINDTGWQNGWPIRWQHNRVVSELISSETGPQRQVEVYTAIMTKLMLYAIRITGKKQITKYLQKLEKRLNKDVLAQADKVGYRLALPD